MEVVPAAKRQKKSAECVACKELNNHKDKPNGDPVFGDKKCGGGNGRANCLMLKNDWVFPEWHPNAGQKPVLQEARKPKAKNA